MSNREVGPVAKELIEAKKRIEDPENWCRGVMRDGNRFCAMGATTPDGHMEIGDGARNALDESATSLFPDSSYDFRGDPPSCYLRPAAWVNDNEGHPAVMKLYEHAINRALSEGK